MIMGETCFGVVLDIFCFYPDPWEDDPKLTCAYFEKLGELDVYGLTIRAY